MAKVEVIKDLRKVRIISQLLEVRCSKQMADIWNFGLNVALRISDLLSIRFSDVNGEKLSLISGSTGKVTEIRLNRKAILLINEIRLRHPTHIYLFQSYRNQQSINRIARPLTRKAVTKAFKLVGDELGIQLGTQSMRKTRGYHLYKKTNDIAKVMQMLEQKNKTIALRYIGIEAQQLDDDSNELLL